MLQVWLINIFLLCQNAAAQPDYSKLVVFGDSLSDTGNIAAVTFSFPFPYYQNRISDGPVAVDYLAAAIGSNADASLHLGSAVGGFNYAVAGGNIVGNDAEDLVAQVAAFLDRVGGAADPLALYAIVAGGNDVRDIRGISSTAVAEQRIDQAIAALIAQLARLSNAGARYFLVANVPDVGQIPETFEKEAGDPGISLRATAYSRLYNQQLRVALQDFARQRGVVIIEFDFFSTVTKLLANAASLGFWHTAVGCFDPGEFSFHPDCIELLEFRFDRFVFFDNLHPSSASHRIVGNAMIKALESFMLQPSPTILSGILMLLLDD